MRIEFRNHAGCGTFNESHSIDRVNVFTFDMNEDIRKAFNYRVRTDIRVSLVGKRRKAGDAGGKQE
jgi:hypothetical protein